MQLLSSAMLALAWCLAVRALHHSTRQIFHARSCIGLASSGCGGIGGLQGALNTVQPLRQQGTVLAAGGVENESNADITNRVGGKGKGWVGAADKALRIMYKFSRPHTIKGTMLASTVGVSRALIENPTAVSLKLVPRAVIGLIALLAGNAFIVGINQIYDVEVDEINKPFLPIAAKILGKNQAWAIVATCLCVGAFATVSTRGRSKRTEQNLPYNPLLTSSPPPPPRQPLSMYTN